MVPNDIIVAHSKLKAIEFMDELRGKRPIFICTIANTETAKIPGISAAGAFPEITDCTPPADVELLFYGKCKCIDGVPVTPRGEPTPALITMSALSLADIPTFAVVGGLRVKPNAPFIDLGGTPGEDIRTGKAVKDAGKLIERAKICGRNFARSADYLVIGESIAGGTTTALGVMLAMGIDARGKVSSSMPNNPHELKIKTVEEGMRAAGIKSGELKDDPARAIECVGDPMIPSFAGLAIGAANRVPVLLAGGTQIGAVLAAINALEPEVMDNLAVGTTRWIIDDKTADLSGIITQIADVPILAANLNFGKSRFSGLRAYEAGIAKEGVGAGGASVAAMLKSDGRITERILLDEIERNYELLVGLT